MVSCDYPKLNTENMAPPKNGLFEKKQPKQNKRTKPNIFCFVFSCPPPQVWVHESQQRWVILRTQWEPPAPREPGTGGANPRPAKQARVTLGTEVPSLCWVAERASIQVCSGGFILYFQRSLTQPRAMVLNAWAYSQVDITTDNDLIC